MQAKTLIIITAVLIGLTGASAYALQAPATSQQTEAQTVETQPVATPEPVVEPVITPEPIETPVEPVSAPEPVNETPAPVAPVVRQPMQLITPVSNETSQTTTEVVTEPIISPLTP